MSVNLTFYTIYGVHVSPFTDIEEVAEKHGLEAVPVAPMDDTYYVVGEVVFAEEEWADYPAKNDEDIRLNQPDIDDKLNSFLEETGQRTSADFFSFVQYG